MRKVLLVMAFWAVTSTLLATDLETIEAKSFNVSGQLVNVSGIGTELAKPWGIQWHLNPDWFKEGVRYKAVFEYFIPATLNSKVTALTLGLWRTKPKAENAATGYVLDLTKVKRGEWQTGEMENLPELPGFSGYFYFDANSKDAYDSAEKIKIKSIRLVPLENLKPKEPADLKNSDGKQFRIPSDLPAVGLALWLDAADKQSMTIESNQGVSVWLDKSGNGGSAAQSAGDNQPCWGPTAIGGKPGVLFDGSNDFLTLKKIEQKDRMEVYIAYRLKNGADGTRCLLGRSSDGPALYAGIGGQNGRPAIYWGGWMAVYALPLFDENIVARFELSSNESLITINESVANNTITAGGLGQWSTISSEVQPFQGAIAEVLIYQRKLSEAEAKKVQEYLRNKWQ